MALMKRCIKCRDVKDEAQFSKCARNKDGLQGNCKTCNSEDNQKFREEINPNYHSDWQRTNPHKLNEYEKKYKRADKTPIIYSIRNPIGQTYIGSSLAYPKVRFGLHRQHYRKGLLGLEKRKIPLLHNSFDKYGLENHTFEVVVELDGYNREQLGFVEASFIRAYKEIGLSLNIKRK